MIYFVFWTILALIIFSPPAHAYLDPASGNALFSVFIAIIGFGIYIFKTIYYKTLGRTSSRSNNNSKLSIDNKKMFNTNNEGLVLFSEGKQYWGTFRPIIDELISEKVHFKYYTTDVEDPALHIDNQYMESKLFSASRRGYKKIENVVASVMLSTTPNIGCRNYLFKRPTYVTNLVHVFHAMDNIQDYLVGSLDYYNTVIMVSEKERSQIRTVEKKRNLAEKHLISLGLPYLDDMYSKLDNDQIYNNLGKPIVLIAPSWGAKSCLNIYGIEFIKSLSKSGYDVIIRLHPHSYKFEMDKVKTWEYELEKFDNITWDRDNIAGKSMLKSSVMISDKSSVRLDYAFLYKKPVITIKIPKENRPGYEFHYLDKEWDDELSLKIGCVINSIELPDICNIVKDTLDNFSSENLVTLRNSWITNFGESSKHIVSFLKEQVKESNLTSIEKELYKRVEDLEEEVKKLREV